MAGHGAGDFNMFEIDGYQPVTRVGEVVINPYPCGEDYHWDNIKRQLRGEDSNEREAALRDELREHFEASPDDLRARAIARFAKHGHHLDPTSITCTASEWAVPLRLPDGTLLPRSVDPRTHTSTLAAFAADRLGADVRLLHEDGQRVAAAKLTRAGVAPGDVLDVMLAQSGGGGSGKREIVDAFTLTKEGLSTTKALHTRLRTDLRAVFVSLGADKDEVCITERKQLMSLAKESHGLFGKLMDHLDGQLADAQNELNTAAAARSKQLREAVRKTERLEEALQKANDKLQEYDPSADPIEVENSAPEVVPAKELRPWQEEVISIIDTEDTLLRAIHWIYDQGETGKSKVLVPWLCKTRGAFLCDPTAKRSMMEQIKVHYQTTPLFRAQPIIFFNVPRVNKVVSSWQFYSTLESVQDDFPVTEGQKGVHSWEGKHPHIFVFSNDEPPTDKIVGRLKVHTIDEDFKLVPDTRVQKALDDFAASKRALQIEIIKSARSGEATTGLLAMRNSRGGAGGSGDSDAHLAVRVAALKRLFKHNKEEENLRRMRHEIYAYIAKYEPEVWELCGDQDQRKKATEELENGQRVHPVIVQPWDRAFATAFDRFKFHHQPAPLASIPQGYSTTELSDI